MKKKIRTQLMDVLVDYVIELAAEDIENQRNVISDLTEFVEELTFDFKKEIEKAFSVYEERYKREAYIKYDLEENITIDVETLKDYLEQYEELEEAISEYLADTYGFCTYGFNFSQNEETIEITNIQWDISF